MANSRFTNIPAVGAANFKPSVDTSGDLPLSGNTLGDVRVVTDAAEIYVWDGGSWVLASGSGGGGGAFKVEKYTISAGQASAKEITLTDTPLSSALVQMIIKGAPGQFNGDDFTVSGSTLSWSGTDLDGILDAGDKVTIFFTPV